MDTNSKKPQPKVMAGGIAGAVTILIIYIAGMAGVEMPAEVAASLATVLQFAAAYLKAGE